MSWSVDRRDFLKVLATVGAGATVGCTGRRKETILARFEPEANVVPGQSIYYATTCRECPVGCGALACTRMGRVVKMEGNPAHPVSKGRLCARGQAAVQGLYNPDRVTKPLVRGDDGELHEISWDGAEKVLYEAISRHLGQAAGSVAWLTGETTDSDNDLLELVADATGMRKPVNLRLAQESALAGAAKRVFGYEGVPELNIAGADLIISVGADFLETWGNPVAQAGGYSQMHAQAEGGHGRSVYVGPRRSSTATVCDEFVPLAPGSDLTALVVIVSGLLESLAGSGGAEPAAARKAISGLDAAGAQKAVGEAAERLRALGAELAQAHAPLVIASGLGPNAEQAHALAYLATHLGGGTGKSIRFPNPGRPPRGDSTETVRSLFSNVDSGAVGVLLVHECNPVFLMPDTAASIEKATYVACLTTQLDETAQRADLVLPLRHSLEVWGDHTSSAGVVSLLQPAMQALTEKTGEDGKESVETRAFADLLIQMSRNLPGRGYSMVPWRSSQQYAEARLETYHRTSGSVQPLDEFMREAKRRGGMWTGVPLSPVELTGETIKAEIPYPDGLSTLFFPHPYWYDGRGADKPWLLEVPESTTAVVWGTWAEVHPETAKNLKLGESDAIVLRRGEKSVTVPALITEQVMPGVVAVPVGLGHTSLGRYASGRGVNPLELLDGDLVLAGMAVDYDVKHGGGRGLRRTAGSQRQDERELARAVDPEHRDEDHGHEHLDTSLTLYPKHPHPINDWAMVIDLDRCTGCGACVAACYAENNVAVVGPERIGEGREMSWIRIEKYVDEEGARFLVNLCQHCHHAPCETVCPVHATYHNPEGLNAMVYNRCVGTRYCSNNCPYKVRRFNFFDYRADAPLNLQYNPYVTVRERGVMEKCTFCIQRIREANETAKNEGRKVRDGEVVTACAQTCPAGAITFGNVKDPVSRVVRLAQEERAYQLLDDLGTRPSVTYLKKVLRHTNEEPEEA